MSPPPRTPRSTRRKQTDFESFAETTSAAIFITHGHGVLYANPAAAQCTGYTRDELLGMELWQIAHPNYQLALKQLGETHSWLEPFPSRYELKIVTKGGEERWLDMTLGDIAYQGKPAVAVTAFDITERDRAERALRKARDELEARVQERTAELAAANEKLNSVLSGITDAYLAFDSEWRFLVVNPIAERKILGRPASELIGKVIWDEYPQTVGQDVYRQYQLAVETGRPVHFEMPSRIVPGHWFEVHAYPRNGGMEVYSRDITERKQAEAEIASLAKFPSENPNPVLRLNQAGEVLYTNEASQTLLQAWARTTGDLTLSYWRSLAAEAIAGQANQSVDIECGGRTYVFSIIPIVEAGYINFYGSDITARKQVEEALRESEERYRLLFDNSLDGILLTTPEGGVQAANAAACRMFGRTEQEICQIGRNGVVDVSDPRVAAAIEKRARTGKSHAEMFLFRGDGTRFLGEVSSTMFKGKDGRLRTSMIVRDITERKKTEEELRRTRDYLENLFQYANAPIICWDTQLNITRFNHAFESLTGHVAAEVLGRHLSLLFPQDSQADSLDKIERTLTEKWQVVEIPILRKDGEVRIALWNSANVYAQDRQTIEATIAQGQDITELKKKEDELARLNRTLRALSDSSQAMLRAQDESEYLEAVCRIVVEDCGHAMVWIGFAEEDEGKTVRPVASAGFEGGYLEALKITWADTERGRGPTGTAIRTGKPSGCRNMLTDPNFEPWRAEALKHGYASSVVLPLIGNGQAFGAITIYSKIPDSFSEEEIGLLAELANDLVYGITTLRLRAAHAQAEEELRLSEERYRALFTGMTEGFALHEILCDEQGRPCDYRFLEINPSFERLTGLKREDVIGKTHNVVLPNDNPRWIKRYGEVALTGQPAHFEDYSPALDRHYDVFAFCPAPHQFAVLFMDITQRKRAEEKMAWLASFPELSPNPVVEVDLDGHLHYLNPAAQRLLPRLASNGVRHPWLAGLEAIGKHFRSKPDHAVMREVTFGEKIYQQFFYYVAASQCVRVYGWDITQRKLAEDELLQMRDELEVRVKERTYELAQANEELRMEIAERERVESQLRLQMTAVQAAANGIVITDRQGSIQWCNPAFTHITGYAGEAVLGQNLRLISSGQHDKEFYRQLWETILAGKVWRGEITNRRKDGRVYVEEQTIAPVLNEQGEITHFVAVKQDITERKQAEDRLERYTQDLLALSKAERDQRQLAETLTAANMALTQSLNLDTVLGTLLDYVEQLVPYDSANVMLLEAESRLAVRLARGYERWGNAESVRAITFDAQTNPVFKALLTTRQSTVVPDTGRQPGWEFRPGVEHVRSWLGVPLVAGGNVIGVYSLDKTEPGFFTPERVRMAEMLAWQAAVAIQNAWLFEQVRAGRERLRSLSRRLVEAQEAERHYVARELHDEAGQALTSLLFGLGQLELQLIDPRQVDQVAELKQMTNSVLESLHRLAIDLRPASLDHLGLVPAALQYVKAIGDRYGLIAQFKAVGFEGERLPSDVETALYRIVQEALTNIVRHAHATRADVLLERRGECVVVVVEDNGCGFVADVARFTQQGHLGLAGMHERAEMLGGSLVIESAAGAGTTVVVEVPYGNSYPHR